MLLVLGVVTSAVTRRPQPLILTRLVIRYFAVELLVLVGCALLWLASGFGLAMGTSRFQSLHYRLLGFFVDGLAEHVLTLLDIGVEPSPSPQAEAALATNQPLLYFSRHAGPADTVLLVHLLVERYRRRPSVVFKDTLALDPCVDLIGHRLPHAVLDLRDPEECEAQIERVTSRLTPRGVLLLFPEGGNFTPERRRLSLQKLWRRGKKREAATGGAMTHVLPPHPAGALAALRANPDAGVVFGAHTGLGTAAFPREIWRHTPIGATLKTRMWLVSADERPTDPDEQVEWLYDWWKRIDEWVDGEGERTPVEVA